jgi:hypothetical protein
VRELKLPEGRISKEALDDAEKPHDAVYEQVSKLGTVEKDSEFYTDVANADKGRGKSIANDAKIKKTKRIHTDDATDDARNFVAEVKIQREHARKNMAAHDDPDKNELGRVQLKIANAYERLLERHAAENGEHELLSEFRASRKALAKIDNVRQALIGNTGHVSASELSRLQERGIPLSGNLKLIADTYDRFPSELRDATSLRNKVDVTALEGAIGGLGAGASLAHPGLGAATVAGVVARPLARKWLLSDAYQERISPGPKKPPAKKRIPQKSATVGAATGFTLQDLEDEGK